MRLLSSSRPELQPSKDSTGAGGSVSGLTHVAVDRLPFVTGYWMKTLLPHPEGLSMGLLITGQLASRRGSDQRERERERLESAPETETIVLPHISEVTQHYFCLLEASH